MRGTRYLETDISNAFASNQRFKRHQDRLREIAGHSRHPAKSQNFSPRKMSNDIGRRPGMNFFNANKDQQMDFRSGNAFEEENDLMDRRLNVEDLQKHYQMGAADISYSRYDQQNDELANEFQDDSLVHNMHSGEPMNVEPPMVDSMAGTDQHTPI